MVSQFYYKNNRLQQIRGFCSTVMFGSVTKAGHEIGLTQAAVSLQIKTLERDLGKKLLQRDKKNSKHFSLTKDGEVFYKMALPILNATDGICDKFHLESIKSYECLFKIAAHHSAISLFLPKAIKKIKAKNNQLRFQISYLQRHDAIEKLINDEIDIAIYPFENLEFLPKGLSAKKVSNYKPALIIPLKHPLAIIPDKKITFEEIGKYNYIHTGNYAISDIMKHNIASKILKSDIDLNHGSWDILKSLVAAGLGVTIFHEDYCKNDSGVVIKKVPHLSPNIAYYAIFKGGVQPKKLVTDLMDLIVLHSK